MQTKLLTLQNSIVRQLAPSEGKFKSHLLNFLHRKLLKNAPLTSRGKLLDVDIFHVPSQQVSTKKPPDKIKTMWKPITQLEMSEVRPKDQQK